MTRKREEKRLVEASKRANGKFENCFTINWNWPCIARDLLALSTHRQPTVVMLSANDESILCATRFRRFKRSGRFLLWHLLRSAQLPMPQYFKLSLHFRCRFLLLFFRVAFALVNRVCRRHHSRSIAAKTGISSCWFRRLALQFVRCAFVVCANRFVCNRSWCHERKWIRVVWQEHSTEWDRERCPDTSHHLIGLSVSVSWKWKDWLTLWLSDKWFRWKSAQKERQKSSDNEF